VRAILRREATREHVFDGPGPFAGMGLRDINSHQAAALDDGIECPGIVRGDGE
jgi:hypothetical protein